MNRIVISCVLYSASLAAPALFARISSVSASNAPVAAAVSAGPLISAVSPSPIPTGSANVTIQGTGFQPGATVIDTDSSGASVQFNTTSVTPTIIVAIGYQGRGATAIFTVINPGSVVSNSFAVPVGSRGNTDYYTLSVVNGKGGGSYTPGSIVTITSNTPPAGESFQNWTGANVANPNAATTTLAMPASNTTVTANYGSGSDYPLIVVNGTGGGSYQAGAIVSIAANPAPAGYTFQSWTGATVANPNNSGTTIVMPAQPTTVTANYAPASGLAVTSVTPAFIPIGVFNISITGNGFQMGMQATLAGKPLSIVYVSPTQLSASGFNTTSGTANLIVSTRRDSSAPFGVQLGPSNALVTPSAARRFLQQAAFGPTSADSATVQQMGFQGWLNQQFAMPKISNYTGMGLQTSFGTMFLTNAVNNPDQTRQRVAFALSQIMVTSVNKNIWTSTTGPFEEMLMADAYSNFRQILNDVTLAPAMGQFLDMANNAMANSDNTVLPNENFAREVMQVFTIGTVLLNNDGTRQLDSNHNSIPAYDQNTVANFAKVFTGWTYAPVDQRRPVWGANINPNAPMVSYPTMHDMTQKSLLRYALPPGVSSTLPAGQTAEADLAQALDNIFYHPNVGPFISKQLIQHLVKSNPTPAYVQRVANAFNNNGNGVRGDMQAVISAILLDSEARQSDVAGMTQATDGHLQEPVLFLAGVLRALGATVTNQNYYAWDLGNMSQDIYNAPSVFNYYSPLYRIPGFGISGPEFQIFTPYSSVYRYNLVSSVFGAWGTNINSYGPGTVVDLTPFVNLAENPSILVDALDLTLTNGLAPAAFKDIVLNAIQAENGGDLLRVQTALYLWLTSGYYNVWN